LIVCSKFAIDLGARPSRIVIRHIRIIVQTVQSVLQDSGGAEIAGAELVDVGADCRAMIPPMIAAGIATKAAIWPSACRLLITVAIVHRPLNPLEKMAPSKGRRADFPALMVRFVKDRQHQPEKKEGDTPYPIADISNVPRCFKDRLRLDIIRCPCSPSFEPTRKYTACRAAPSC
jgi:hypothetical protein